MADRGHNFERLAPNLPRRFDHRRKRTDHVARAQQDHTAGGNGGWHGSIAAGDYHRSQRLSWCRSMFVPRNDAKRPSGKTTGDEA
jgi:hypothetical protein